MYCDPNLGPVGLDDSDLRINQNILSTTWCGAAHATAESYTCRWELYTFMHNFHPVDAKTRRPASCVDTNEDLGRKLQLA
jgi:hypothetical protein